MYLQIAQRSPRMIAAMNCVNTIVTSSTFPTFNSWAKARFNVDSDISADHVLGVTVGNEKLNKCAVFVCRDEARHPALRGFFCLCFAHHAASPAASLATELLEPSYGRGSASLAAA